MSKPIRVALADDHPIIVDGLVARMEAQPDIQVVARATSFQQLVELLSVTPSDVLLLDLSGMGQPPLPFLARLRQQYPRMAIIVFSSSVDLVNKMLQNDIGGYVVKGDHTDHVLAAIRAVHKGKVYLSPIAEAHHARWSAEPAELTPQETTVLMLVAKGYSKTEIAEELTIDPRTVHNYMAKLRRKTGCREPVELADWYERVYGGGNA